MRRLLLIVVLSCLLWPALPVQACSGGGGPPPLAQSVAEADLIVEGRVLHADRWGKNFIFEVDRYLKGDGPHHLLVTRISSAHSRSYYEARLDLGCLYDGASGVREGEGYTLFLRLHPTGTASSRLGVYYAEWNDLEHEWSEDDLQPIARLNEGDEWIKLESPAQFAALIESLIGPPPQPRSERVDHRLPLFAPLFARTRDGAVYRFSVQPEGQPYRLDSPPMDEMYQPFSLPNMFVSPTSCQKWGCILRSPDGVYSLHWEWEDDALRFDGGVIPLYQELKEFHRAEQLVANWRMAGQAAMFAPSSDAFAVWDGLRLSVWAVGTVNSDSYTGPYLPAIQRLHRLNLVGNDPSAWAGLARWSADGNFLAYQDAEGLWLLDVYGTDDPRLIVPNDLLGGGRLLAVSAHGRYVAYGTPQGWTTYDHIFGVSWPNALISPDERHRLSLSDEQMSRPLLWTGEAEYLAFADGWVRTQRADLRSVNYTRDGDGLEIKAPSAGLLAYTPYGRSVAIQTGERQISIQHRPFHERRFEWTLELPEDSAPLAALWWGAPFFVPVERYPR